MRAGRRRTRAALRSLDHRVLHLLRTRGHRPRIETAVIGLAKTGESGLIWYALAGRGAALWGRSYPSAHATASFAGARVLSKALPTGPVYALALAMALSRAYRGAHYPSDVIAGAVLGDAVAVLVP
jgi:membrane-associated phospholipid phosphatase